MATYGGGVNILRWNEKTKTWSAPEVVEDGMKVRDIELVNGILWCGTTTGILRVNPATGESTVLPSYDIRAVSYCQDRIWFGSFGGGLMTIDPQDTALTVVYAETFHDIILSMAADSTNLWFCSELDIAQLNLETGMLYYYNALDGEPNSYFTEAEAVITPEGKILFGFSNGYVSMDPSLIRRSKAVPPVYITRIETQDGEMEGDTVTVDNGSTITIDYAAIDYIGADKIVYYYKMDGVDKEWRYVQAQRQVTYSNLRHGTYVFHVRSTNREGGEVDNEKQVVIIVQNPVWLSWWAILLYILGIVAIVVLTVYAIGIYNGLRQRVKVEQQVTDIKLRFFTNISHELRTPLTLIAAPVENILQTEHITPSVRSQLEIVLSNSQRMLRMVNQLL